MNRIEITKFKNPLSVLLLALTFSIYSCDNKKCVNSNVIFDHFDVDNREYKMELAKQIQNIGIHNLTFFFDQYFKKEGKEFILVNISGIGLCAKGKLLVRDWGKLKGIRETSGSGYRGAEMKGLKMDIEQDVSKLEFVYKDVDRIID